MPILILDTIFAKCCDYIEAHLCYTNIVNLVWHYRPRTTQTSSDVPWPSGRNDPAYPEALNCQTLQLCSKQTDLHWQSQSIHFVTNFNLRNISICSKNLAVSKCCSMNIHNTFIIRHRRQMNGRCVYLKGNAINLPNQLRER